MLNARPTTQLQAFFHAMAATTKAAVDVAASPSATNTEALRAQLKDTIRSVEQLQAAVEFPSGPRRVRIGGAR